MRLLGTVDRLTSTYYSTLFLIFHIFGKEISEISFFIEKCIFFAVAGSHFQNGVGENMNFFLFFTNTVIEQVIAMINNFTKLLLTLQYPNEFAYQQVPQAKTTNVIIISTSFISSPIKSPIPKINNLSGLSIIPIPSCEMPNLSAAARA